MADIEGTMIFTGERSQAGYRLNRFAWSLTGSDVREHFRANPERTMREAGLSPAEVRLILECDWTGAVAAGGSIYLLIKIAGALGVNLLQVGAQMRGETLEQFMETRRGARKD